MKKIIVILLFFICPFVFAQQEQLAQDYLDKGEYEKALTLFNEIYSKQPSNYYFFQKVVECYQQQKLYDKAEEILLQKKDKHNLPRLFVELGYNAQLQKNTDKAESFYEKAINEVKEEPNYAQQVAVEFERKVLLNWALKAYETAEKVNPNISFTYPIALLQGQIGNLEIMVDKLLDYSYKYPNNTVIVQSQFSRFLLDDNEGTFSNILKKSLVLKTQQSQDTYWNEFYSWLLVQQKEYGKAFIQEKAVFKRNTDRFSNIIALSKLAIDDKQYEDAQSILEFILANTQDVNILIQAHSRLLKIEIDNAQQKDYVVINEKISTLLNKFGKTPQSVELQSLSANFQTFYLNQPENGKKTLEDALELPLNNREKAKLKLQLADILLYDEKINQAILYYAQVEENLKNDEIAHEASMKMAKANFYKKDFDWTFQQVKVLKQSASLLIANDAVELFLLIQDNSEEDSLRIALQDFAKADYYLYKNQKENAIKAFEDILIKHKGKSIEDITLLKLGNIYNSKKDYTKATHYYQEILDNLKESIYTDEAYFFLAEIYNYHLADKEKAKQFYEKILFNHQDSIYYTEARKQYRILRGDTNL